MQAPKISPPNYQQSLIFLKHACLFDDALAEHGNESIVKRCTHEQRMRSEARKNNAKNIILWSKLMKQMENRVNKHACRNRVSCEMESSKMQR